MAQHSPQPGPSRRRSLSRERSRRRRMSGSPSNTRSRSPHHRSRRYRSLTRSHSRSPVRSSSRSRSRSISSAASVVRARPASPGRSRSNSSASSAISVGQDSSVRFSSPAGSQRSASPAESERSGSRAQSASPTRSATGSPVSSPNRSLSASTLPQKTETCGSPRHKKVMKWFKENSRGKYHPSKESLAQRLQFNVMRENKTLTDMVLKCQGRTFTCHKLILASSSQYFERMFQSEMQETHNEVKLTVMSADILSLILDWMYTADINFTWQKTTEVLCAADFLQMDTLKELGSWYLMDKLDPDTALQIHKMAKTCNLKHVQEKAWDSITNNFREVISSKHFLQLHVVNLVKILHADELNVPNEDLVVHAALTWTHHNLLERRDNFHTVLLPILRLSYCTKYMLSQLITSEPLVSSQECQAKLAVALAQSVAPPCHPPPLGGLGPRDCFLQHHQCLVLFSSRSSLDDYIYDDHNRMYYLDQNPDCDQPRDKELEWKEVSDVYKTFYPLYERIVEYSVCALPRGFFVSGGREVEEFTSEEYDTYSFARAAMFNSKTKRWQSLDDMDHARYKHASVHLNDEVFVIGGGTTSNRLLEDISVFDLIKKEWQWQSSSTCIPHRVAYPAVAAHGHNIYVLGGQDSQECFTNHTQVFNTCLNKWQPAAQMPACPLYASAVSLSEHVYVAGGFQSTVCLRYTPKTDTWTELSGPMFHHAHAALTTWQGKLILAGGLYQAEDTTAPHNQIELYNPDTDSWEKAPSPPLPSKLPREMSHVCLAYAVYNDIKSTEDYDDIVTDSNSESEESMQL